MYTKTFRFITLITIFVSALGIYTPGQAASSAALTAGKIINIAYFFKPPNMDAGSAVYNFDTIVLTNGDHVYRDQLINVGFASAIPQYFRSEAVYDPGGCTLSTLNNTVAYNTGDFCWINQNHPDWFLLDASGRRITVVNGKNYYRMDPGNAGWRDFFVTRVIQSQQQYGWTALFLDDVEAGLGKFYDTKPVKYPDNASYQAAVQGFLQYLYMNYAQKYGRPVYGNIVARADEAVWFNYLQYLNGAMQERFAVDWNESSYVSVNQWNKDMSLMEQTQANGKYVILVSPGYQTDLNRENFAFASYLLISNGKAAFRYSTDSAYRDVWLYDNYKINIGIPIGPRYQSGSFWRRDFTLGYVIVDPVNHVATITTTTVPSTFIDVPSYYWAWQYVERLYSAGITGGCGGGRYCPENQVTRDQMAVLLLRGIHGSSYTPPAVGSSTGFTDVPTSYWAAAWIKQFAAENITGGCGSGKYCPAAAVTRAQMAVFLLKSKHGSNYVPPAVGTSTGFIDVPTSYPMAPWIKQLVAEGISGGCGSQMYCPYNAITRAEMAVLLVRTFNLP